MRLRPAEPSTAPGTKRNLKSEVVRPEDDPLRASGLAPSSLLCSLASSWRALEASRFTPLVFTPLAFTPLVLPKYFTPPGQSLAQEFLPIKDKSYRAERGQRKSLPPLQGACKSGKVFLRRAIAGLDTTFSPSHAHVWSLGPPSAPSSGQIRPTSVLRAPVAAELGVTSWEWTSGQGKEERSPQKAEE